MQTDVISNNSSTMPTMYVPIFDDKRYLPNLPTPLDFLKAVAGWI
jgi:hypothetical protein